ncbi:primosomal replication protein PriC [Pasteurella bettyae]|uniref:primosomal replication protein PriC n=1 Tax=Pasteurella bettyae TaxID=752 RepID=UPI003D2A3FB6
MQKLTALIDKLQEKVTTLTKQFSNAADKKIYAKFDRTLFTEDFEKGAFYFSQLQQTLDQIKQLNNDQIEQISFFTEKLLAQCTALTDALNIVELQTNKTATKTAQNKREKLKAQINQLPPRERLVRYYEALQALNEKVSELQDNLEICTTAQDKGIYLRQIEITNQRKARCIEAIDILEEYLSFQEEKEEKENNKIENS